MSESRSCSETLAAYCTQLRLDAVPREVRQKAALCVLDTVGCMIAGAANRVGKIMTAHAASSAKRGNCTLIGSQERIQVEAAVLANATMAHVLELDDGHRPSGNHLGCVIVPAALAAAEHSGATGAALLTAVIAGYDVMGRAGAAVCLPRTGQRFHGTATTGGFGAAAVAGVLWKLSADEVANALGIAGSGAGGSHEVLVTGLDCKPFQVGRSAASGIKAAQLACAGLKGPQQVFEGKYGFVGSMTTEPRPELVASELGARYAVMDCGFKIHATCGRLFTPVDAALALRKEHALQPSQIERISVGLPAWLEDDAVFMRPRPPTVGAARFSIPFGVAAALKDGEVSIRQMSDAGIADAEIAALERKVEITVDPRVERIYQKTKHDEFFFHPASVTLTVAGKHYYHLAESPHGYDLRRRLTVDEIRAKFVANVSGVFETSAAQRLADVLLDLENLDSVDKLSALRSV